MLQKIETFFTANKVLFLGIVSAAVMAGQQLISATTNWKVVGFAALLAALSFAAKSLTGRTASVIGIVGSAVGAIAVTATGGVVNWTQVISTAVGAIILVLSAPADTTTAK